MLIMFYALGEPTQTTVVRSLVPENPIAAQAGVKPGDELVAIDNTHVVNSTDAVKTLGTS